MTPEEKLKKQQEKNAEYWKGRFEQIEQARHDIAAEFDLRVKEAVQEAIAAIERDVAVWYHRIAENNEVSLSEAKRLLKADELKEFKWSVDQYIKAGRQNNIDGSWAKELENASAKFHITRLEAVKMDIRNSVETLYAREVNAAEEMAQRIFLRDYYHTAFEIQKGIGVGWNIAAIDRTAMEALLHRPWAADGLNFSERIWGNKTKLVNDLSQLLTRNVMLGRPPGDAVKDLMERTGRAETEAARLLYTESAYFGTISQHAAFVDLGAKKYQFVATLDEITSDICRELDSQVFELKDMQPGVNAPPMHPWCRSATAPYYADMADVGVRAARNPETGKTEYVPRSMTYKQWHEKYVKDKDEYRESSLMKKVKETK